MIHAILSQNFIAQIYTLFPQVFRLHNYFHILIFWISKNPKGHKNIARGTTGPGYRVYNLSYLSSSINQSMFICQRQPNGFSKDEGL